MELKPSKNPRFVKSFNFTLKFKEIDDARWMLTYSKVKIYASLIIKKYRIVVEDTYSDFVFFESKQEESLAQ